MEGSFRICRVRARLSHGGPGEPTGFFTGAAWKEVDEIVDRWYEGGLDPQEQLILYFKVRYGGDTFLLRYLPHFQRWQILGPVEG